MTKLPFKLSGYTIAESKGGGKAGKGKNKTATIQVREPSGGSGYFLMAQFRYTKSHWRNREAAIIKTVSWVKSR